MATSQEETKHRLDQQFERTSRALFLIMIGGLALVPTLPGGTWLVGTGLIMLGLNAARYLNGIRLSPFTLLLGIAGIVLGTAQFVGNDLPVLPLILILIGSSILWRMFQERWHVS